MTNHKSRNGYRPVISYFTHCKGKVGGGKEINGVLCGGFVSAFL